MLPLRELKKHVSLVDYQSKNDWWVINNLTSEFHDPITYGISFAMYMHKYCVFPLLLVQAKDFWREACILSNLHHPNVVAFYGVVPDGAGGTLATVAEFMANGSLRTALMRKDKYEQFLFSYILQFNSLFGHDFHKFSCRLLDHRKKLIIAMDAAFGMEYLHSKNIVHFDLKCDNLLVNLRDPERPICKVLLDHIEKWGGLYEHHSGISHLYSLVIKKKKNHLIL